MFIGAKGKIVLAGATPTNAAGNIISDDSLLNTTYKQQGELDIGIGGTEAYRDFGVLAVGGAATLGGTLMVSLSNGFVPSDGESFQILSAGSINGTFSSVLLPDGMTLNYTPTAVIVSVVPEPALLTLFIAAGAAAALRRQRRRPIHYPSFRFQS